jgi:hypothetical protein
MGYNHNPKGRWIMEDHKACADPAKEIARLMRLINKAADQLSDLKQENYRLRAMCGLSPKQPIPEMMS